MPHPLCYQLYHSAKVFSAKCSLPTNPRKFSPLKVSCYMVVHACICHIITLFYVVGCFLIIYYFVQSFLFRSLVQLHYMLCFAGRNILILWLGISSSMIIVGRPHMCDHWVGHQTALKSCAIKFIPTIMDFVMKHRKVHHAKHMDNTSMCMLHPVGKLVECKVYNIIVTEQMC